MWDKIAVRKEIRILEVLDKVKRKNCVILIFEKFGSRASSWAKLAFSVTIMDSLGLETTQHFYVGIAKYFCLQGVLNI